MRMKKRRQFLREVEIIVQIRNFGRSSSQPEDIVYNEIIAVG